MPTFKEIIAQDVNNIFFRDNFFSDAHYWNGRPVNCIIDNNEIIRRYSEYNQANPTGMLFILIPESEFIEPPGLDAVRFDDGYYSVLDIKNEDGVLAVLLSAGGMR